MKIRISKGVIIQPQNIKKQLRTNVTVRVFY